MKILPMYISVYPQTLIRMIFDEDGARTVLFSRMAVDKRIRLWKSVSDIAQRTVSLKILV